MFLPYTRIPMYGFLIFLGISIASVMAYFLCKKRGILFEDSIIIEATFGLFGFVGAKLFYIIQQIFIGSIKDRSSLLNSMNGGFVFYGGFLFCFIGYGILLKFYRKHLNFILGCIMFFLPFVHGFGRLGCLSASCCYGIPYDGPFHITYSNAIFAPNGVGLFPVQPLEAIFLFALSFYLYYRGIKGKNPIFNIPIYLLSYACIRFLLEYLRGDRIRGIYYGLSTSQWISLALIVGTGIWIVFIICERRYRNQNLRE